MLYFLIGYLMYLYFGAVGVMLTVAVLVLEVAIKMIVITYVNKNDRNNKC